MGGLPRGERLGPGTLGVQCIDEHHARVGRDEAGLHELRDEPGRPLGYPVVDLGADPLALHPDRLPAQRRPERVEVGEVGVLPRERLLRPHLVGTGELEPGGSVQGVPDGVDKGRELVGRGAEGLLELRTRRAAGAAGHHRKDRPDRPRRQDQVRRLLPARPHECAGEDAEGRVRSCGQRGPGAGPDGGVRPRARERAARQRQQQRAEEEVAPVQHDGVLSSPPPRTPAPARCVSRLRSSP